MRSYGGTTGHFIEDFKLKSVMLACHRFKGPDTAKNILLNYQQVTCNFNIERKITTIITDNAANMIKAFVALPGFEVDNVSVSDSDDEDNEMEFLPGFNILDYLPKHVPCFAHTNQLVVKDGLKEIGSISNTINRGS
ncbi:hypothetical protein LOD99_9377 [Oopsacas minuta]|uniref:Uncharacterized protein n=1 Tax=Oopsacas minuta TaxID=111878 RepID=A0AAV7JCN4_9METZ|nr:hypothetical protein LOD99_9377 [Oopsacas minuta]